MGNHRWEIEAEREALLEEWLSSLPTVPEGKALGDIIETLWMSGSDEELRVGIKEVAEKSKLTTRQVRARLVRAFGPR